METEEEGTGRNAWHGKIENLLAVRRRLNGGYCESLRRNMSSGLDLFLLRRIKMLAQKTRAPCTGCAPPQ